MDKKRDWNRGRKAIDYPIWSIDPFDSRNRATCVHISILIKEKPDCTLCELAKRLSAGKRRPFAECLEVLQGMLDRGHLGYFDDKHYFVQWTPREENDK